MSQPAEKVVTLHRSGRKTANSLILENAANELVFAVVGHVGSGTSAIADKLRNLLRDRGAIGEPYDVEYLRATDVIADWARRRNKDVPTVGADGKKTIDYVTRFQDLGDAMRGETDDHTAVAKAIAIRIREYRASKQKQTIAPGDVVAPDGQRRAYVIDSIRHPAEVQLLRHIYQEAFVLIGVVCESDTRAQRVSKKYGDAGLVQVQTLMQRDEKAVEKNGQKVADAFHLADFFIDNTPSRSRADGTPNPEWDIPDQLSRLIKIIRQQDVERPLSSETAMWHAHGAAMRSACLSRQVGAALVDRDGNVVATGTNEVPKAGGGVYGEGFTPAVETDHRCAHRSINGEEPYCSNSREHNTIVSDLVTSIKNIKDLNEEESRRVSDVFRKGRIGEILEFSRAVHAEMDAILTAGRKGISTIGTRLFVTTFPCHYCARHVVTAGIDEVQYIEPYPKSQALRLHNDSVQITAEQWRIPSNQAQAQLSAYELSQRGGSPHEPKVLFRPFTGVAPRLYRRAFLKDGDLKDPKTGARRVSTPEWGSPWHLRRLSYAELEAELSNEMGG